MTYVLIASAAFGGILLFLLAAASANTPLFAEHYPLLLVLNAVIAAALLALVIYQLVVLARQRRAKVFGSLLTFRLLVMFAIIAVLPRALVSTGSVQVRAKSIESWFDVRVDKALEGGLNLGRAALDAMLSDLARKANSMALDLSGVQGAQQTLVLGRLREQVGVEDALLLTMGGRVLSSASREAVTLVPAMPPAIALAFLLSGRLSEPLAVLAEGTQAVARGDFSRRAPVTSRDELGVLTQSFNSMTEQLDEARSAAEANHEQLETAKAYLESLLANLSAGVLVFDAGLALRTINRAAENILHEDLSSLLGMPPERWQTLPQVADTLRDQFAKQLEGAWQRQIELPERVIVLRGSALPVTSGGGYGVVFDDITQLITAPRPTP